MESEPEDCKPDVFIVDCYKVETENMSRQLSYITSDIQQGAALRQEIADQESKPTQISSQHNGTSRKHPKDRQFQNDEHQPRINNIRSAENQEDQNDDLDLDMEVTEMELEEAHSLFTAICQLWEDNFANVSVSDASKDVQEPTPRDASSVIAPETPPRKKVTCNKKLVTKKVNSCRDNFQKPTRPCLYCGLWQTHVTRHLIRKHSKEKEVEAALKMSGIEQRKAFSILRKKGILKVNLRNQSEGKELVRERRGKGEVVMCSGCSGFYDAGRISVHKLRYCNKSSDKLRTAKIQNLPKATTFNTEDVDNFFKMNILNRFKEDEVGQICITDMATILLGTTLWEKVIQRESENIRCEMRKFASVVLSFKKEFGNESATWEDVFNHKHFNTLEKAVKSLSDREGGEEYETFRASIGLTLKKAVKSMRGYLKAVGEKQGDSEFRKFVELLDRKWNLGVSECGRKAVYDCISVFSGIRNVGNSLSDSIDRSGISRKKPRTEGVNSVTARRAMPSSRSTQSICSQPVQDQKSIEKRQQNCTQKTTATEQTFTLKRKSGKQDCLELTTSYKGAADLMLTCSDETAQSCGSDCVSSYDQQDGGCCSLKHGQHDVETSTVAVGQQYSEPSTLIPTQNQDSPTRPDLRASTSANHRVETVISDSTNDGDTGKSQSSMCVTNQVQNSASHTQDPHPVDSEPVTSSGETSPSCSQSIPSSTVAATGNSSRKYTKWSEGDSSLIHTYFTKYISDTSNIGRLPRKKELLEFLEEHPGILEGHTNKYDLVRTKIFNEKARFRKIYCQN